jgi:cyclopropane fatty-acyl-phospholipid synthase-like methyltransferase
MNAHRLIQFIPKYNEAYEDQKKRLNNSKLNFFNCYKSVRKDCIDCESTLKETFDLIFSKLKLRNTLTFLDCGCGLGHVLYLASRLFENVYGVEYNKKIVSICRNNLAVLNVNNVEIINCDILEMDNSILDKINVFYLFNPFIGRVFSGFIRNIVKSVQQNNREVWMIYLNAICEDIMLKYSDVLPLTDSFLCRKKINIYHHRKSF